MKDFIDVIELRPLLKDLRISAETNFEDIFSDLWENNEILICGCGLNNSRKQKDKAQIIGCLSASAAFEVVSPSRGEWRPLMLSLARRARVEARRAALIPRPRDSPGRVRSLHGYSAGPHRRSAL
jgi:hypothetical protein